MTSRETTAARTPNLVRIDQKVWTPEEAQDSPAEERQSGFIFREGGDWFGSDRYMIVRLLGKGGMCEVWLARDRWAEPDDPKRFVAIKVLQSKLEIDDKSRRRLKAEALAFMRIKNDPNLPRVYHADIDPERNLFYYVMEYLRGETLDERIRRVGPLPLAQAMRIVASATEAVQVIHNMGIIHRDLKPENVFLTEDGRVVLLDLGVAKFDEERFPGRSTFRTDDASIAGTFAYMSPEQSLGEKLDVRSDVYALGIIAYCCVAGRHPAQETPGGWMPNGYRAWSGWHINNQPKPLHLVVPGLPASVWTVVSRAIAKDREQRFASAADLAIEFRDLMETAEQIAQLIPPISHHVPSVAERTTEPQTALQPAQPLRCYTSALATTEESATRSPGAQSSAGTRADSRRDPQGRAELVPSAPRFAAPLPLASEPASETPITANGTEIIAPLSRSSTLTGSVRTSNGTEIIAVPPRSGLPSNHRTQHGAPARESRRTPSRCVTSSPSVPGDTGRAKSLGTTVGAQAVSIASPTTTRPPRRRIAAFGLGGLLIGLLAALLATTLVRSITRHGGDEPVSTGAARAASSEPASLPDSPSSRPSVALSPTSVPAPIVLGTSSAVASSAPPPAVVPAGTDKPQQRMPASPPSKAPRSTAKTDRILD